MPILNEATAGSQDSAFVPRLYHRCWLLPRLLALPEQGLLEMEGITAVFVVASRQKSRDLLPVVIVNHNYPIEVFRSTKLWKFFPFCFWIFIDNETIEIKKCDDKNNIVWQKNIIVIENFMTEEEVQSFFKIQLSLG